LWNEGGGAGFPILMLRRIACLLLLACLVVRAETGDAPSTADTEGVPPLLFDALGKLAQDFDRWAFTETLQMTDEKGVPKPATVVRFDPSKPYAEQFQPLKVSGKPPTDRQLESYRRRGEKRGEKFARQEAEGKTPGSELPSFSFNGGKATIDLARATVVTEDAGSVTYEVPLRNDGRGNIPVDKFQLVARVGRQSHAFENVSLRLRGAVRVKLVVKIKSGEASIDFGTVDPAHAPTLVTVSGDASATVFFVKFGGSFALKRTDFKRVKPYSERFGVKIGPLKALDF